MLAKQYSQNHSNNQGQGKNKPPLVTDKTDRQVINSQKKIKKQSIGRTMQINTNFKVDPQNSIDKHQFSLNNSVTVSPNAQHQNSPN